MWNLRNYSFLHTCSLEYSVPVFPNFLTALPRSPTERCTVAEQVICFDLQNWSQHRTLWHQLRTSTKQSVVLCNQQKASVRLKINTHRQNTPTPDWCFKRIRRRAAWENVCFCPGSSHEKKLKKACILMWGLVVVVAAVKLVCRCLFQPPHPPATSTRTHAQKEILKIALLCYVVRPMKGMWTWLHSNLFFD